MSNNLKQNNLINEKSPYLLQHAHNPVDWFPWGAEAFVKAKEEDKPVFLSIGYSTCHWCHVMGKESFEDLEVAKILNEGFVAIKVDKESRPDIDAVYMNVCQALTGQGGWPLTIIMTPDRKPFFAGTYFPKNSNNFAVGLIDILAQISDKWDTQKNKLVESSENIVNIIKDFQVSKNQEVDSPKDLILKEIGTLKSIFDSKNGGFGDKPKFPSPHNLMMLIRAYQNEGDQHALDMVEMTLRQMYRGGIFDHIGYGFSRYSTDEKWLTPHFEKMLYDNALLAIVYLETYLVTKDNFYKSVAIKIFGYLTRDMQNPQGGFFSAQDADSDGEEGKFYTFSYRELIDFLGEEDGLYFTNWFGCTKNGNFERENILNLLQNKNYIKENSKINNLTKKLYLYRKNREKLHLDHKILTSWNALLVIAFIKAYKVLDDERYLKLSLKTLNFIQNRLIDKDLNVFIENIDGKSSGQGILDDYAFLLWAYIEFYEATFEPQYLEKALKLYNKLVDLFFDFDNGGFYLYSNVAEKLILKPKEIYDGAIPSGNSVLTYSIIKLQNITGDPKIDEILEKQLDYMINNVADYPYGHSFFIMALMLKVYPARNLICTINNNSDIKKLKELNQKVLDNFHVIVKDNDNSRIIDAMLPFMQNYKIVDKSKYYLCENGACKAPVSDLEDTAGILQ